MPGGPHQRKLKNYLLDSHLQLRYAGYLVGIAAAVSVVFGLALFATNQQLYETSQEAVAVGRLSVKAGSQSVEAGRSAIEENKKVNEVVKMNIVEDPTYKDNPELLQAFQEDARQKDASLLQRQKELEEHAGQLTENAQALVANADSLEAQMQRQAWIVAAGILCFISFIGLGGIVVSHKIAGPLFKIKRHVRELGDGSLGMPSDLRKGDELVEFFRTFQRTVGKLRTQAENDIAVLDQVVSSLSGAVPDEDLRLLRELRERISRSLN